jgi:hypothetical protein
LTREDLGKGERVKRIAFHACETEGEEEVEKEGKR